MTGWRVGYIAGPSEIIDAINELQQYVVMSSSSIAQHAALEALAHQPHEIREKYHEKRDLLVKELGKLGFEVNGAQGAFYLFVKAPHGLTDIEFVDKATEHNLIIVPGRAFSQLHGFVRISYGADLATIKRGIKALAKTVSQL